MKYLLLLSSVIIFGTFSYASEKASNVYEMSVTAKGYEPSSLKVKANEPITLKITRKTHGTCAREITVPDQKINVALPVDKEVIVKLAPLAKGEIKFGCAMDLMIGGVIIAE